MADDKLPATVPLTPKVEGMCLVLAGQPFDMVKVQLQAMRGGPAPSSTATTASTPVSRTSTSAMTVARTIVARDGVKGLYRGMSAPLIGVTPIFAVCFWAYDVGKQVIKGQMGYTSDAQLSLLEIGVAGAASAIPTTAIMAPGERIKVLLQTNGGNANASSSAAPASHKFNGPGDVVRHLVKTEGVGSLFRGSAATLLRDGIGSFAYFAVYEHIKRTLTPPAAPGQTKPALSPTAVILGGGFAGVCNWLVAIPFDTIKSRIQMATVSSGTGVASRPGVISTAQQLIREEGPKALFKGVGPALLRAFPANAACFLGMEVSKAALDKVM